MLQSEKKRTMETRGVRAPEYTQLPRRHNVGKCTVTIRSYVPVGSSYDHCRYVSPEVNYYVFLSMTASRDLKTLRN